MTDPRPHLLGMFPDELAAHLRSRGVPLRDEEGWRVMARAVAGEPGLPLKRPVSRQVAAALEALVDRAPLEVAERAEDPADGFVKYLFRLPDGAVAEAVRIPLEKPGRFSVCLSSQAGCAMACTFCATGRLGLSRSLQAWEMVAQLVQVAREAPGRVSGAVFQGQGEPLANYDAVLKAARILSHPRCGRIGGDAISISTVGLVPGILRMADERPRHRLIVSLTSAIDARRRELLPVASAWGVDEVAAAIRAYQRAMGGRVTVAWVVLGGVNTGEDEVEALHRLFDGVPLRLNLIDVNDPRPDGFRRATPGELAAFRTALKRLGVPVVRRYSGGAARHAACGMLAGVHAAGGAPAAPGLAAALAG